MVGRSTNLPGRLMVRTCFGRTLALCAVVGLGACAPTEDADTDGATDDTALVLTPIDALNAFYYYEDLDAAWAFYRDVLGFETAADYGFAKIMHVAPRSFLTLVDVEHGMHSADEPKSVALAIVTRDLEAWFAHLETHEVPLRSELTIREGSAHDGFVAVDPEGYLLEFEWFNEHEENVDLSPRLAVIEPTTTNQRPADLGISATVLWLYYDDLAPNERFYEALLAEELLVDQGWAKIYQASPTGYIGLVDGARGMHSSTEENAVTVSFMTEDVRAWMAHARALGVELRSDSIGMESDLVETFVGYDPTGYFLEWDNFLDRAGNERIIDIIR
ncbi:MAG: VOC family protein [Longimicrobiales bacterium]